MKFSMYVTMSRKISVLKRNYGTAFTDITLKRSSISDSVLLHFERDWFANLVLQIQILLTASFQLLPIHYFEKFSDAALRADCTQVSLTEYRQEINVTPNTQPRKKSKEIKKRYG